MSWGNNVQQNHEIQAYTENDQSFIQKKKTKNKERNCFLLFIKVQQEVERLIAY